MWCILCICVILLAVPASTQLEGDAVNVTAWVGTIQGQNIYDKVSYIRFLGIPYGEVDAADPFGPAEYHSHFKTPFRAYTASTKCPQIINNIPEGSIDCLHLDIYVPYNMTFDANLPVMVYVHGGLFTEGDGDFKTPMTPVYLMEWDVILVTINYRLGPYGFLCLPELGYSNQGLKDIALALEWINDNIGDFGGNQMNILLFGQGTGSVLVELLMLFDKENYFDKVILQSGQIVSPALNNEPANEAFITKVAGKLGIDAESLSIKEVMKLLSKVETGLLINATKSDRYRPCVDGKYIKKTPAKVNLNKTKIIVGTTAREMLYFYKNNETYLKNIKQELDKGFTSLPDDAVDKVKSFYLKGNEKDDVIDFATDFLFNYPVERSIRYYLDNNATVFRYVFSQIGGPYWMKANVPATYGDDIAYIFGLSLLRYIADIGDHYVTVMMAKMWTKFAQYSDPTIWHDTFSNTTKPWLKVTKESRNYLNISMASNFSMQEGPYSERMAFWDRFYEEYGKYSKGFNYGEQYTIDV